MNTSLPAARGDDPAEAFFAGAREGVLMIQRCRVCGSHQFALPELAAAVRFCRTCTAPRPPWVAAQGTGIVVSLTVIPGRRRPDGGTPPPRVAGIVELVEGPWVHAAIDSGPDTLAVGQAVRAGFADGLEPDRPVPVFRPV
jgi:uncharacterized OB-fold protein